ncbi:MAG TPA: CcmD family protein [Dehalococcoidia bacterium]|nr:CcmD family protein [Dehalococcoidia bacterium]
MPPITALQIELPSTNLPWLFAAFAVSWAVFFLYAIYVTRRQQEMESQIRQLRRTLDQRETTEPE